MESISADRGLAAVAQFAALAHETRLAIFRLLVAAGNPGRPAGEIAGMLDLPPATLSFHLRNLKQAGLVTCRREGRSLIYRADLLAINALIAYLTENCCAGTDCGVPTLTECLS